MVEKDFSTPFLIQHELDRMQVLMPGGLSAHIETPLKWQVPDLLKQYERLSLTVEGQSDNLSQWKRAFPSGKGATIDTKEWRIEFLNGVRYGDLHLRKSSGYPDYRILHDRNGAVTMKGKEIMWYPEYSDYRGKPGTWSILPIMNSWETTTGYRLEVERLFETERVGMSFIIDLETQLLVLNIMRQ